MKFLRNYLDKIKPSFEKGAKFGKLHSTFEAFESFLFVPNKVTTRGSHIRDSYDLKRNMMVVIIALLPALLFGMWNVGYQYSVATGNESLAVFPNFWFGFWRVLPIIVVSYVTGLGIEFISAQIRGHEVNEGFLVTGMLIPLIMPVDVPLWMVALATAFAVILGKEVFGGTGMNIWNPALLARAFVFFSYPSVISGDKAWIVDGFSGATPLSFAAANEVAEIAPVSDMFWGFIPGSIGETSTAAIIIGALILLFTRVASWRIMLSVVIGALATGFLLNLVAPETAYYMQLPPYYHLLMGGFAFGAVFMATDPVTSAQTGVGKWVYGLLIGVLTVIIRVFNIGYPEGMMLAILLMNSFAPLIDYYVVQSNIRKRMRRVKTEVKP